MAHLITRPMLAEKAEFHQIHYPCIASPKYDGVRCLKLEGAALARSLKPIPNEHVRKTLERLLPEGIDGEIMAGDTFQDCTSGIMSQKGEPSFTFWAFDIVTISLEEPYVERLKELWRAVEAVGDPRVKLVPTMICRNAEELELFEANCLSDGYEGVIARHPEGPYKCGRSTVRQGWMLKIKRFVDAEAEITGFEEMMHNENEKQVNELGLTKRSSAKAGKVPAGTLGKFYVTDIKTGIQFKIGTGEGLTFDMRQDIWDNRDSYIGKIVKYKSQPHGVKDAPRIPIFIGFRDPIDMDPKKGE